MPTRIFFSNGDQMTVSDEVDAVAQVLGLGGFAKLDRPWGDSSVYVNPTAVNYCESQDERSPGQERGQASLGGRHARAPLPRPGVDQLASIGPQPVRHLLAGAVAEARYESIVPTHSVGARIGARDAVAVEGAVEDCQPAG